MDFVKLNLFYILFLVTAFVNAEPLADESEVLTKMLPPPISFPDIARKNGYQCEVHNITTEDGYILQLFRIPGDASRPVLMMHGLFDSADSYILREYTSHAFTMAREGYDVWAGNMRGNRYSRNHVSLNPNTDASFWDYSVEEMGTIDLAAFIDFILDRTGQSQLSAIGHSEGTSIFFVLCSSKPEYNKKIKVLAALAPIAHCQNTRGSLSVLMPLVPEINAVLESVNYQEILGFYSNIRSLLRWICEIPGIGYELCFVNGMSPGIGPDTIQIDENFFSKVFEVFPSGSSKKNLLHLAQIGRSKSFAQYDYGPEQNLKKYGSSTPPEYDVSKVTIPVGMYLGLNDFASTVADVEILRNQLPNVVDYQILAFPLWNHFDHLYAKDLPIYLQPFLIKLLGKYNS